MILTSSLQAMLCLLLSSLYILSGYTKALIHTNEVAHPHASAHCSGSEGVDDSSFGVLPVPVVALFVPHWDLHTMKADDYLKRCGD